MKIAVSKKMKSWILISPTHRSKIFFMRRCAKEDIPPTSEVFLHITIGWANGDPCYLPGKKNVSCDHFTMTGNRPGTNAQLNSQSW